jgi:aspartate ammonia-lyase
MPGKVNPVIPEVVNQVYYLLLGSCRTVEAAAEAAQLQLGVMFPILADTVITALKLSHQALERFNQGCLSVVELNYDKIQEHLLSSTALATLLTPLLGYDTVASVVESVRSSNRPLVEILQEKGLYTTEVQAALSLKTSD